MQWGDVWTVLQFRWGGHLAGWQQRVHNKGSEVKETVDKHSCGHKWTRDRKGVCDYRSRLLGKRDPRSFGTTLKGIDLLSVSVSLSHFYSQTVAYLAETEYRPKHTKSYCHVASCYTAAYTYKDTTRKLAIVVVWLARTKPPCAYLVYSIGALCH